MKPYKAMNEIATIQEIQKISGDDSTSQFKLRRQNKNGNLNQVL